MMSEDDDSIREEAAEAAYEEATRVLDHQIESQFNLRAEAIDLIKIDLTALGVIFSARALNLGLLQGVWSLVIPSVLLIYSIVCALSGYWELKQSFGIAPESYSILMKEQEMPVYEKLVDKRADGIEVTAEAAGEMKRFLGIGWISTILSILTLFSFILLNANPVI